MLFPGERNLNTYREFNSRVRRELKLSLLVSVTRGKSCLVRRLQIAERGHQVLLGGHGPAAPQGGEEICPHQSITLRLTPVTFSFSSEGLMGANSARCSQPAGPHAHWCLAELATQHKLPLPAGGGEHPPAQELELGGSLSWGPVLLATCTGRSVPHTRVPHPSPLPLHPFHNNVQRPTPQGGAPFPRWGGRHLYPSRPFSVDQRRWEHGMGVIRVPQSLLRSVPKNFFAFL